MGRQIGPPGPPSDLAQRFFVQSRPHLCPLELQPATLRRRNRTIAVRAADTDNMDWHASGASVGEAAPPLIVVGRIVAVGYEEDVLGAAVVCVKRTHRHA